MASAAVDKQGRSRCDSPAPRSLVAAPIPGGPDCKDDAPETASPIFIAAFLVAGLGYIKVLIDAKKPLSDSSTWMALLVFLGMGSLVMRFDVHDIALQDARKDGTQSVPAKQRSNASWTFLLVASLLALALGVIFAGLAEMPTGLLPTAPIASQRPVHVAPSSAPLSQQMVADLFLRSAKATKNDMENIYGRYLDASLNIWSDHSAAHRCARNEVATIVARQAGTCITSTTASRWRNSVQWSDEAATFLLSVVLMLGIAASRSDFAQMFREQQEHARAEVFEADDFPSADKCLKGSQARSQWRFYACIVLLLAVVASAIAAFVEEM